MTTTQEAAEAVERDGFTVIEDALDTDAIHRLIRGVVVATREKAGNRHGLRNLFDQVPETRGLVTNTRIAALVEAVLGPSAFAVRAILFDKLEGANWHVGWHQDQAIAIKQHAEAPGFGPTSTKHGVPHTRGSAEVLEQMLAVRIHLDDCGPDNGPLRCVPASHRQGRLNPDQSLACRDRLGERTCTVNRGGVLLMRPLCLHASSPAAQPQHRRVIHIEFAACELPAPLAWFERQPIRP